MSYWDETGRRIEMGPERGPDPGVDRLHFGDFITDTGRLSGSNLVSMAHELPDEAVALVAEFAASLPQDRRPNSLLALLNGCIEWTDITEVALFLALIGDEEETDERI